MEKKHSPNFAVPLTGQMLIPQQCKDCYFRFKVPYDDGIEQFDVGWKRGDCHIYPVVKPDGVLKNYEYCEYYEKEKPEKKTKKK
ncbi:MAG: hypothetical protein LUG85_02770 [Clostridiales bacterium]|nr:hypothetical protein [Clostridiales bacterium]